MNKTNLLILLLIVLVLSLGLVYYLKKQPMHDIPKPVASVPEPQKPIKLPIVHYPVPAPEETPPAEPTAPTPVEQTAETALPLPSPLPAIGQSDKSIHSLFQELVPDQKLLALFTQDNFIQRLVTTIDSLPEKKLSQANLPIQPPKGSFLVAGTDAKPQTSSRNHKRYQAYVELLEAFPPEQLVKAYIYYYPLFQKAYEQLGYQNAYFNDRLIYVIDHLEKTPDPPEPIALEQPKILYTYADPLLENLSAGQKILLRIGPEARKKTLNILKDYRQRLSKLRP